MAGIAFYSLFLMLGMLYSDKVFEEKSICFKIWTGGIIGNIVLMLGIVPLAFIFGFSKTAHVILAAVFLAGYIFIPRKRGKLNIGKMYVPGTVMVFMVGMLMCILLTNHIMIPINGGIASGQSTYGDLAMHMGFVTSIAEKGTFPPEFNLLSGTKLCYPFLIDSLSSSLYLFGTGLRVSILYPSYVFAFLISAGFYYFAEELTQSKKTAVLAMVLFFFGGGFGFAYFMDGAKENTGIFTRIFSQYYQMPTNLNERGIRWANPICDMIIPQRTTMAGWCILFFALWILCRALKENKRKSYIILGLTAGSMPMIHTHSFLSLGIISIAVFFAFLPSQTDKKAYFLNWCIYGGIAALLALPQLFFWTFSQSVGNEQFVRFGFNWVNEADPYLWFWLKNWGITAIFALPAVLSANVFQKKIALGAVSIFVLAELIIFQPNEYDNNKLFFVSYMIAVILCADYLLMLYKRLKDIGGIRSIASMVVIAGVFSGVLTIAREWKSGGEYLTFTDEEIEFAQFVKKKTDANSVFITGNEHLNPISVLAGRTIYAGSELYVYYHGYGEEMEKRYAQVKELYESRTAEELKTCLQAMPEIGYIMVTDKERSMFEIDENVSFGKKIYDKDKIFLYEVKYY